MWNSPQVKRHPEKPFGLFAKIKVKASPQRRQSYYLIERSPLRITSFQSVPNAVILLSKAVSLHRFDIMLHGCDGLKVLWRGQRAADVARFLPHAKRLVKVAIRCRRSTISSKSLSRPFPLGMRGGELIINRTGEPFSCTIFSAQCSRQDQRCHVEVSHATIATLKFKIAEDWIFWWILLGSWFWGLGLTANCCH